MFGRFQGLGKHRQGSGKRRRPACMRIAVLALTGLLLIPAALQAQVRPGPPRPAEPPLPPMQRPLPRPVVQQRRAPAVPPEAAASRTRTADPAVQATIAPAPAPPVPGAENSAELVNEAVRLRLRKNISANFDGVRLSNALLFLRTNTGVSFQVDWNELQRIGVVPYTQVFLRTESTPADQVVQLMLNQISPPFAAQQLAFAVINGMAVISTRNQLADLVPVAVRVYDIRDILADAGKYTPERGLEEVQGNVVALIEQTVGQPNQWQVGNAWAPPPVASVLNGRLFVKAAAQDHRQVGQILAALRSSETELSKAEGVPLEKFTPMAGQSEVEMARTPPPERP